MRKVCFKRGDVEKCKGEMPLYKTRRSLQQSERIELFNECIAKLVVQKNHFKGG